MTWTRLSDDFSDDTWTLTDAAYRLHSDGLVWSNRKLLDLRIPREDLARFSKRPDAVQELLDGGWWREDGPEHYLIQHHGVYQRTREQVIKQQETNQANGKRGGRPRKPGRESRTESVTESLGDSVTTGSPDSAVETRSLSDSSTETETHRDGTGLALKEPTNAGTTDLPAKPPDCGECQRRMGMGGKPECPVIARGDVCNQPARNLRKAS